MKSEMREEEKKTSVSTTRAKTKRAMCPHISCMAAALPPDKEGPG